MTFGQILIRKGHNSIVVVELNTFCFNFCVLAYSRKIPSNEFQESGSKLISNINNII